MKPSETLTFSDRELDLVVEMMRAAGINTIAGVIHVAMWRFADHLDLDPPRDLFLAAPHVKRRKKRPATVVEPHQASHL